MKMLTLCLGVILITTITNLLFSENVPVLQMQGMTGAFARAVHGNIFYQDPENKILLIDFKEVEHKLIKVQVRREGDVVLEDTVRDLANDSIYEIDLKTLAEGKYKVMLLTIDNTYIEKDFAIE